MADRSLQSRRNGIPGAGRGEGRPAPPRRRRGATLPIMGMALVVMIGASSLCVDVSLLGVRKQHHGNGCDAAALAGGMELPASRSAAEARARETAAANGLGGPVRVTVQFPADNRIEVSSEETVPLFLARIFGMSETAVRARAAATVEPAERVRGNAPAGLRPWGIEDDYFYAMRNSTPDTLYTLKAGTSLDVADGNYYPLSLGNNSGAAGYANAVRFGSPRDHYVGEWVESQPGNVVGPTQQGVDYLIERASVPPWSLQTPFTATAANPRVVVLPIVDWDSASAGRTRVPIRGFAPFYVQGTAGHAVVGYLMRHLLAGNGQAGDQSPPVDGGLRVLRLVE